jgi:glutaconyl-CoA decarboxylase
MEASMKKYNITVNGTVYTVEVEEVGAPASAPLSVPAAAAQVPAPAAPAQSNAPAPAPAQSKPPAPAPAQSPAPVASAAGATIVDCPMPGTILDVLVEPGQSVKSGETLLVLEAMKMENEIVAPDDGVVDTVRVSKGASVNAGDVLVTLL